MDQIIELDLKLQRKARIWADTRLSEAAFSADKILTSTIPQIEKLHKETSKSFAVELSIPAGGRKKYGLLGGQFTYSNSSSDCMLSIFSADSKGIFKTPLYAGLDEVKVGLPLLYAETVKQTLLDSIKSGTRAASGELLIDIGAHSHVGSSEDVFEKLAKAIYLYLFSEQTFDQEKDFFTLFPFID